MKNAEKNSTKAPADAEEGELVAPEKATSKKVSSEKKGGAKAKTAAKTDKVKQSAAAKKDTGAKKATQPGPAKEARKLRAESRCAKIMEMISQPQGATLAEIMKAADWQPHSVRGFISTSGKKHQIESSKNEAGDRVYKIAK